MIFLFGFLVYFEWFKKSWVCQIKICILNSKGKGMTPKSHEKWMCYILNNFSMRIKHWFDLLLITMFFYILFILSDLNSCECTKYKILKNLLNLKGKVMRKLKKKLQVHVES